MKNYQKGRRNEYRSMRVLEAAGYLCLRAAGSHSPFDVVAITSSDIMLVQCKSNEWPCPAEIERIEAVRVPPSTRKVVHRWDNGHKLPQVKEIV